MKRIILCIALLIAVAHGDVYAQEYLAKRFKEYHSSTPTEQRFMGSMYANINDFLYLKNGKMIFELVDLNDYNSIRGIDTVMEQLLEDISFYRDSLENGSENVRIDYIVNNPGAHREMRFIKYNQRGETFVKRDGKTERLKIEQDTVRIIYNRVNYKSEGEGVMFGTDKSGKKAKIRLGKAAWIYPVQVTILVNDYRDIRKVLTERDVIKNSMDTLIAARSKKEADMPTFQPTACIFHPYTTNYRIKEQRLVKFPHLLKKEYGQYNDWRTPAQLSFYTNGCVGVVRNTLSPFAEVGISLKDRVYENRKSSYFFTLLSVSPFFFFKHDDKDSYWVEDNWFINLERGGSFKNDILGFKSKQYSYGLGYLAIQKGDYFKGTTVKFFISATILNGVTLSPELIATDTFRQIFPGMTMKIKVI